MIELTELEKQLHVEIDEVIAELLGLGIDISLISDEDEDEEEECQCGCCQGLDCEDCCCQGLDCEDCEGCEDDDEEEEEELEDNFNEGYADASYIAGFISSLVSVGLTPAEAMIVYFEEQE